MIISDLCSKHMEKNFLPKPSFPSCACHHLPGAGSAGSKNQPKLPQIWSKTVTREALIKSESFRERFWKNPQVSRWGFQATPHSQPLLEVTPGQLGFAHQRGSSSSHTEDEIRFLQPSPHLNPPHPRPEPTCQSQHHGMAHSWNTLGWTEIFPPGRFPNTLNTSSF